MIDIEVMKRWLDFLLAIFVAWPTSKTIAFTYPVGIALGYYWTQALKRGLRRNKSIKRERFTRLELQMISSVISGHVIGILASAFFDPPLDQLLAHSVIGGALCPFVIGLVIRFCEWKYPAKAQAIITAEQRTPETDRRAPSPHPGDFDPETSGKWWKS